MDRDEAIRRAEIAMAWARGEEVQFQTSVPKWIDYKDDPDNSPEFFSRYLDWRIKPKPLEYWAFFEDGRNLPCDSASGCYSQDDLPNLKSGRWVRMVEKQ